MRVQNAFLASLLLLGASTALAVWASIAGKGHLAIFFSTSTALMVLFTSFMVRHILKPLKKFGRLCPVLPHGKSAMGVVAACLEHLSASVKENTEAHNRVIKNIPCAAIELDSTLNIISINEEARRLTGFGPEVLERPFSTLLPDGHWEVLKSVLEDALEASYASRAKCAMLLKNGAAPVLEFNIIPVAMEGGKRLLITAKDSAEADAVREELEKARVEAEENSARLKKTISELEEFALMAVRREMKMREIRERLSELKEESVQTKKYTH